MAFTNNRLLALLVGVFALIVVAMVAAGVGGVVLVDTVRAYVAGEGFYSKAQKGAVLSLHRYAATGDEAHFAEYTQLIEVPVGDRLAREALEDRGRPVSDSYTHFEAGENHPQDVAGMAWLFRMAGETPLFAPSIQNWRDGDRKIAELDEAAQALQRSVEGGDRNAVAADLRRIDSIDAELDVVERAFSANMGIAARQIAALWRGGTMVLGAVLLMAAGCFAFSTTRRIAATEREIRKSETRFRDVAEQAADWIWETDAEMRFTYLSDRMETVAGADCASFLGKRRWELDTDPGPQGWEAHIAALERREPVRDFAYGIRVEDGAIRTFNINGRPVHDETGAFVGYRGTGTDITAAVAAKREAEEKRGLLETTFENLGQGVHVYDEDQRLVLVNQRFFEMLGLPAEEFALGEPFEKLIRFQHALGEYGEVDVEALVHERVRLAGAFAPQCFERERRDGTIIEARGQPLPWGGFVTTYRDVTAQRRMQIELESARAAAEAANDAKSAFLASMSHEIRTPMNGVLGMAAALAETRLDGEQQRMLDVIVNSGKVLTTVIDDVLDISKIEAGRIEIEATPFDLGELLAPVEHVYALRAHGKGLAFRLDIAEAARGRFIGDPTRIRQVIDNLLSNAFKFTDEGAVAVVVDVSTPRGEGDSADVEITFDVTDTGPGIEAEQMGRLFEAFSQADPSTTRRHGGTGLGLAISRRLAALMGGGVEAQSEVGQGSLFRFSVRVSPATAETAPREVADPAAILAGRKLRLLVAEDHATNRLIVKQLLKRFDVDLTIVENGCEAIAAWERDGFDAILMDVQMPEMDGMQATADIRRREAAQGRERTPIVALTANAMSHQVQQYLDGGMDGHVAKPIRMDALLGALAALQDGGKTNAAASRAEHQLR